MVGGFGVFGPGRFRGGCEYPHSPAYAAKQAFDFAGSCAKTWEYAKETNCDVYLNPHPHLCDLLQLAEKNQKREKDDPNALVIGLEGVRKWIEELFDKCVESALQYTDIKTSVAD